MMCRGRRMSSSYKPCFRVFREHEHIFCGLSFGKIRRIFVIWTSTPSSHTVVLAPTKEQTRRK